MTLPGSRRSCMRRSRLPRPDGLRNRAAFAGLSRARAAQHHRGLRSPSLGAFSAERMHLLIEAKKLAFADRNRYAGDPRLRPLAARAAHLEGARRQTPRGDRPEARAVARGRGGARAQRRHQLLRGGRWRGQCRLVHTQPVELVRLVRRRGRDRHHAQQPRGPRLQPRPGSSQRDRARAAARCIR